MKTAHITCVVSSEKSSGEYAIREALCAYLTKQKVPFICTTIVLDTHHDCTTQLVRALSDIEHTDYLLTFTFWATALVARVRNSTTCVAVSGLHLYSCDASPQLCDTTWGHAGMRGVRRLDCDYRSLVAKLRALFPHVTRLLVPFDRDLFTQMPELVPPAFYRELSISAKVGGFELVYVGLDHSQAPQLEKRHLRSPVIPANAGIHSGDLPAIAWGNLDGSTYKNNATAGPLLLMLANTGFERYADDLQMLCRQHSLLSLWHECCRLPQGAARTYSRGRSSLGEILGEMLLQQRNGQTVENKTLKRRGHMRCIHPKQGCVAKMNERSSMVHKYLEVVCEKQP